MRATGVSEIGALSWAGRLYGTWRVLSEPERVVHPRVLARCEACGLLRHRRCAALQAGRTGCDGCSRPGRRLARAVVPRHWAALPYESDPCAQEVVQLAKSVGGLPLDDIAYLIGASFYAVRRDLARAIRKISRRPGDRVTL